MLWVKEQRAVLALHTEVGRDNHEAVTSLHHGNRASVAHYFQEQICMPKICLKGGRWNQKPVLGLDWVIYIYIVG